MATTTLTAGNVGNAAGYPAHDMIEATYDATENVGAAADVFQMIAVPAGTFVHRVFYEVLAADATQTMNVGDGSDVDGFIAAADVGTAGNKGVTTFALTEGAPNTVTGYSGGKFYSAADTIDIEVPATKAYDTLKVRIVAEVSYMGVRS